MEAARSGSLARVRQLREAGNAAFADGKFAAALREYDFAVDLFRFEVANLARSLTITGPPLFWRDAGRPILGGQGLTGREGVRHACTGCTAGPGVPVRATVQSWRRATPIAAPSGGFGSPAGLQDCGMQW